jgi:hypothetical protein
VLRRPHSDLAWVVRRCDPHRAGTARGPRLTARQLAHPDRWGRSHWEIGRESRGSRYHHCIIDHNDHEVNDRMIMPMMYISYKILYYCPLQCAEVPARPRGACETSPPPYSYVPKRYSTVVPHTHVLFWCPAQLHRATAQLCQHADLIVAEGGFDARDSRFDARTDADGGIAAG